MNKQPMMPDPSVDRRLLDNLRQARLSFEEVDLQMEEVIAKFDELIRQQKLQRIKQKQKISRSSPKHVCYRSSISVRFAGSCS